MSLILTISTSGPESSDKAILKTARNAVWIEFCRVANILALKISEPSPFDLDRIVEVDAPVDPGLFYPFLNGDSLECVVALLVLAFPDAKFRFTNVSPSEHPNNDLAIAAAAFHAGREFAAFPESFAPMFDPCGLRTWILWRHGGEELVGADASQGSDNADNRVLLSNRLQRRALESEVDTTEKALPTAVVLDDESEFALFAGYVCYRSGYLAQTISSWAAATARLSATVPDAAIRHASPLEDSPTLAVEDIWLNYNAGKGVKLEDRGVRYDLLPKLKGVFHVTISTADDWKDTQQSEPYIFVHKPFPGAFSFWKSVTSSKRKLPTTVYSPVPNVKPFRSGGGHPAPDRMVALAEFMVGRARNLLPDVRSMVDAVRGAVLAGDALDLLVTGRAVTSALEALSLKHQFEVLAECRFMGVRAELDIEDRFAEIENVAEVIVHHIEPIGDRQSVANSALMDIATNIARVFQEHGRFQEEQDSLANQRKYLDRFLRSQKDPWSKTKGVLLVCPHLLLRSLTTFVLVLAAWASSLTLIHLLLTPVHDPTSNVIGGYGLYLAYTIGSFMSFELWSGDPHSLWRLCAITAGVFHFGVLLTYLYSAVSRK